MTWARFVAVWMFLAMSFVWNQWRRGKGRAGTVIGVVAFFAVFWAMLLLTGK